MRRTTGALATGIGLAGAGLGLVLLARRHRGRAGELPVRKATTIRRPQEEVYDFWRDLENLSRFMTHLESVQPLDETRSRWRAHRPGGRSVEWEAEIVDERPAELLAWRSLPGGDVEHSGTVRFSPAPGDRGTEVVVELRWSPPGGALGSAAAELAGVDPATQLADDLRRLKQVLEAGEIARSDGSPRGHELARQLRQRPARPAEEKEVTAR